MSSKVNDNVTNYSFPYMREADNRSRCEKIVNSIWNPSEKTIFGRTVKSWGQLLLFYAIFYAALSSLFAISMKGLLSTISEREPKWKLDESAIGTNPGVGFRPISENTEEGSLIWYSPKNSQQVNKWVGLINKFLNPYFEKGGPNQMVCDFNMPPQPGKVCEVNVRSWNPCTGNDSYSYPTGSPCIFIKLNRIFGWMPEVYNDINNLPPDMPKDLKKHIKSLAEPERQQVWVSCMGEDPADREVIKPEDIEYIPHRGFPLYYYPFHNAHGYLSPLVAIKLKRPPLHRIVSIECRAWAKNIQYIGGHKERQGSVHFEVLID